MSNQDAKLFLISFFNFLIFDDFSCSLNVSEVFYFVTNSMFGFYPFIPV